MKLKRCLLLGIKAMTNPDSILKSRDITLLTKVHIIKAMVFPVVMHWCESWTIKKAECQRIDPFEVWCCRRLLGVPWTARESNQSILKEISPEYSLEGLMLKLMLQYFGHLMRRANSLEKIMMSGKTESRRRRGYKRQDVSSDNRDWHSLMPSTELVDGITYLMNMSLLKLREEGHAAVHGVTERQTRLNNWTTKNSHQEKKEEDSNQ